MRRLGVIITNRFANIKVKTFCDGKNEGIGSFFWEAISDFAISHGGCSAQKNRVFIQYFTIQRPGYVIENGKKVRRLRKRVAI